MGTDIRFVFYNNFVEKTYKEALDLINEVENKLSVFKSKSMISKLNKFGRYFSIKVSTDVYELIKTSVEYSQFTEGYFDITIKRLLDLWKEAEINNKIPSEQDIEDALLSVGSDKIVFLPNNKIKLKNGSKLDFGAIAKGFVADKIEKIFYNGGITSAIVDLGGHILTIGKKEDSSAWKIGIRHPLKSQNDIICHLQLEATSIVTSASYERYFKINNKKFSHIINPKTGYPANNDILSITVVDKNSTFADALSTALFAMGFKKAINFVQEHKNINAIIISPLKDIFVTPDLVEKLVLCDKSFRVIKLTEVIML